MKAAPNTRTAFAIFLVLLLLQFPPTLAFAQENQDMPPTLAEALDEAVQLLEKERYEDFITKFAHPEDLASILSETTMAELVGDFKVEKAGVLLEALKSSLGQSPEMRDDGKTAAFADKEGRPLVFALLDGRWYLKN